MNITATAVAVTLAVIIALAFLFLGPGILRPFQPATTASSTPTTMNTSDASNTPNAASGAPMGPAAGASASPAIPNPLPTTLTITDEKVGTGEAAKAGDTVTVNYVGMLPDGTVFDASQKHGQAFTFQLGAGMVIKGWDQGVAGMKVGGVRRLIIPADLAYGAQGAGGIIPPNATLIFDVELMKIGQ